MEWKSMPDRESLWPNGARPGGDGVPAVRGGRTTRQRGGRTDRRTETGRVSRSRAELVLRIEVHVNGVPRILDLMDKHQVRMSSFMIGYAVRRRPKVAAEIANRGHRAWAHGRRSKRQYLSHRCAATSDDGDRSARAPFETSVAGACARKDEIATWTLPHPETAMWVERDPAPLSGCPAATDTTNDR
jgi:hypothetical protein